MATPYSVHSVEEVTSTQDVAASLFTDHPVLVVAHRQQAGRGRSGSAWQTAPRAMAASLAFAPAWPKATWNVLPLVAGLAAAEVVGDSCRLKWPNDLLIDGYKVGGLLSEALGDRVIIGCGLNLHWPDSPEGIGAVYPNDPGPEAIESTARDWTDQLLARISAGPEEWGRLGYASRCDTIGRMVSWEPGGRGRAVAIDQDGALVVETQGRFLRLTAGAVRHLRAT